MMTFDEFKAVATIDRKEIKVRWTKDGYPCSCIWWPMPKQTDGQVLRGVWWQYYGKYAEEKAKAEKAKEEQAKAEAIKPVEHASKGVWYQPTITTPDSSTMDFIREKCECEAMTGY